MRLRAEEIVRKTALAQRSAERLAFYSTLPQGGVAPIDAEPLVAFELRLIRRHLLAALELLDLGNDWRFVPSAVHDDRPV